MESVALVEELLGADIVEDEGWESECKWGVEVEKQENEGCIAPCSSFSWVNPRTGENHVLYCDPDGRISRPYVKTVDEKASRVSGAGNVVLRSVCLLLDYSDSLKSQPMFKTVSPANFFLRALQEFTEEFFELCPLGELCVVVCKEKCAISLCGLVSEAEQVINALQEYGNEEDPVGNVSLQAGLERAWQLLNATRLPYSRREILCLWSSTSTHDAGLIQDTITLLKNNNIHVNVISVAPHVHILERLTENCNGQYWVLRDELSVRERISHYSRAQPPDALKTENLNPIHVGFPQLEQSICAALCSCHNRLKFSGYTCPRCLGRNCAVPSVCAVCGLLLVKALDVARCAKSSYEITPFIPVSKHEIPKDCYMCDRKVLSGGGRCLECYNLFCFDCDVMVHELLLPCPGCQYANLLKRQGLTLHQSDPPAPLPLEHPQALFYKRHVEALN